MDADVVIAGGGLVGASLACALDGLRVAVVDPAPQPPRPEGPFDSRVYALSPGNVAFLRRVGAWDRMPSGAATAVHAMDVRGDDGRSRLEFDAWDTGVPELAWIVEERLLLSALRAAQEGRPGVARYSPARCTAIEIGADAVEVQLDGGTRLAAQLLVGADGAGSFVRDAAGIAVTERPYGHSGVVANFACDRAHGNVARQWFQQGAVLALLPMAGNHVSMVWSVPDDRAGQLLALSPEALCSEVEQAGGGAVGGLAVVTPPRAFPLRRIAAASMVRERVALVGDAAHVVHPLAGQGVNLGFGDVRVLSEVLAAREPGRDVGDRLLLRRFERARAEAILAMDSTVHGLFSLFGAANGAARRLRNAGMECMDRAGVLKNMLIRHAMQ